MHKTTYKQNFLLLPIALLSFASMLSAQNMPSSPIWEGEIQYTGKFSGVSKKNAYVGSAYLGLLQARFSASSDALGWWQGGTLNIAGMVSHGGTPSVSFAEDIQVYSNIENGYFPAFYEIWYRQESGKVAFQVGQQDLNAEFMLVDLADVFMNSSFGITPSITCNMPVSTYPNTTLGGFLHVTPSEAWSFKAGVFDGDPGVCEENAYNLDFSLGNGGGVLGIGEWQFNNNAQDKSGYLKIGGYYHTAPLVDLVDTTSMLGGNYGLYLSAQQKLTSNGGEGKGLGIFLQLGYAPEDRNIVKGYVGTGLHYAGLFSKKIPDRLGLGVAWASMSEVAVARDGLPKEEIALELTWQGWLTEWFFIQPDLQCIIHQRKKTNITSVWAGTMRFNILIQ